MNKKGGTVPMTIYERFYYSKWYVTRTAERAMKWMSTRSDSDERKKTYMSNTHATVKFEIVKGVLTFTVHVRLERKDGGLSTWGYKKYEIVDVSDDNNAMKDSDIPFKDRYAIRFNRGGKYTFKN